MSIRNVWDFIETLKKVKSIKNHENYFRGHPDIKYKLVPGIYRNGLIKKEDVFFKESIIRVPNAFDSCKTTLEKLVKMQHYGVPTRLLDITSNPLVALYFACNKNPTKDGEVIFLSIPNDSIKFFDSDTISILANISRRPINFNFETTERSIETFNQSAEIEYLLHEIKDEKPYFQNLINYNDLLKVFAVKVKLDNPRIIKQNGAFLIFGVDRLKKFQANIPSEWHLNKFKPGVNLKIPHNYKKNILKELDILGINNSTLFPELENQALYLKDKLKNGKA